MTALVYVEPKRSYFARYEGRTRTVKCEMDLVGTDAPYWVEKLRAHPEEWDQQPEAA